MPYKRHGVCTETGGAGIATEQSNNIIYLIIYLGIIMALCVFNRFRPMGLDDEGICRTEFVPCAHRRVANEMSKRGVGGPNGI